MGSTPPRLFRFTYPDSRTNGPPGLHQLRDADAFTQLAAVLAPPFVYSGPLLNDDGLSIEPRLFVETDLVVTNSRIPLDDDRVDGHKRSVLTHSPLEQCIVAALRPYFRVCARSLVSLSPEVAASLDERFADRAVIGFKVHGEAIYRNLRRADDLRDHRPPRTGLTAAFFIRVPMW